MGYSLFTLLILSMAIVNFGLKINIQYEWKYTEFEWESQEQKEAAINSGAYNPYNSLLADASKADDGRIFITATNLNGPGSPVTLTTVTNKTGPGGPVLRPYPDWSWYNSSCICDGIVNVYRTDIKCNHIIVMDNGQIGLNRICNPKLLIFDLKNNTLVKTIYLPLDFATNRTGFGLLVMPLVYIPKECTQFLNKMIVFIVDSGGSGLIVYDSSTKHMCRVESDYMKPTDIFFSVANKNFTFEGGIYSMTILDDELYYIPASGKNIYKIKIKTLLQCPNKKEANKQNKFVTTLSNQSIVLTSTEHSIFYSNLLENSILGMNVCKNSILGINICKNSNKNEVELAQDDEKFQVINSMKVSNYWNEMICMSNRYQNYLMNISNLSDINYRYFEIKLSEVQKIMNQHVYVLDFNIF
ncbi:PREDICTED: major royal jelly protein 3-like [Cyphomyrmex costatus]|uniref:major royal jelly protein 3-like n=1 Tax=Cyphomyrmex costatus TaxID=456900 RepID=UPI00085221C0|nr:PREDICTED: major royal jelly protein 3-like [Cyphomyrmex costatus]